MTLKNNANKHKNGANKHSLNKESLNEPKKIVKKYFKWTKTVFQMNKNSISNEQKKYFKWTKTLF